VRKRERERERERERWVWLFETKPQNNGDGFLSFTKLINVRIDTRSDFEYLKDG